MDKKGGNGDPPELGELPHKVRQGKDEMNLAEFPLSAIAERVDPGQKTLMFEDKTWDESRGEMVTRKLTITASDQYGLPTALDDEVILGLVQLSKLRNNFEDRRVSFTRYQLIQLLGWRDESKSYDRLEKSLNRWVGVTLYYENAWWDKKEKSWVDEKFHIIDNVSLYDREKSRRRTGQGTLPISTFTWNDVLFRSFNAGNLKSIDFDFYRALESSIAKRLYRFLDKRFFHRTRWEFDLKEVSWEHIGLSRNYDAANLKRKLLPAIHELEQARFLEPMGAEDRFRKVRSGEWRVVFEKAGGAANRQLPRDDDAEAQTLIQALTVRGVTPSTAQDAVASHPKDRILAQLEVFDWLVTKNDPKVARNPAGFLISSIKSEYVPPVGFLSREEKERRAKQAAERKQKAEDQVKRAAEEETRKNMLKKDAALNFWDGLSEDERFRLEAEALAAAPPLQRELVGRGGPFAKATRKAILDAYALKMLSAAA